MDAATTDTVNDLKTKALTAIATPLLTALAAIQANPTQLNVVAQGVALQGALVGVLPAMQTTGISDAAALLHAEITKLLTSLTVPAATATLDQTKP